MSAVRNLAFLHKELMECEAENNIQNGQSGKNMQEKDGSLQE